MKISEHTHCSADTTVTMTTTTVGYLSVAVTSASHSLRTHQNFDSLASSTSTPNSAQQLASANPRFHGASPIGVWTVS